MNRFTTFGVATAIIGVMAIPTAAFANDAHVHIGHVATGWMDTPDNAGLLTTAESEAGVALQHAGLALSKPSNLDSITLHTRHVMHAINPESQAGGPGGGYGLAKAASEANTHIGLAAGTGDASDAVKLHAAHVGASTKNVVSWSGEAMRLAEAVLAADDATAAAESAAAMRDLLEAIVNGTDANGDGRISWREGEGGLTQARVHLGLMMKAEGLD